MKRSSRWIVAGSLMFMVAGLCSAEEGYFDSGGVKIFYKVEGSGEPVLLIHGYRTSHVPNWSMPGTIKFLAREYKVIVLDNRGHGKSDKPENVEAYGEIMVGDAVGLLDHLGIESAHVVGYSMGGMIALKMMATHPERVRSAVVGGMGWMQLGPARPARSAGPGQNSPNPALVACARAFPRLGLERAELAGIKVPFTVLIGENDGLLQSRVEPLSEVRPDISVVIIPKSTHANCIFKPAFKAGIKDFLDRTSAEGGAQGRVAD